MNFVHSISIYSCNGKVPNKLKCYIDNESYDVSN